MAANYPESMQASYSDKLSPAHLFSRERRKQRMLQFLEAFERRSWPGAREANFLVPVSRADVREAARAERNPARR